MRGAPGCGKSTWIREHGLEDYALSADNIRMMCAGPTLTVSGGVSINQNNDKAVWNILFQMLEVRMQNGEFTVIDATNSKAAEMNRYKELATEYKYRIYCVDLTNIPIEVAKERNAARPELKRVPEFVIDRMYSRFATQKIPSGITVISPVELDKIWMKPADFSDYKVVHHIGDVHGCYTALMKYFELNGGMKDDEAYIFCGDLTDRGIENAEVVKFMLSIYNKPNVKLIEGNHEKWLKLWAEDEKTGSREFEAETRRQLDEGRVSKKEVRQLYRRIGQCVYYTYAGNKVIVTHAGISRLPENIVTVSATQMIKGVGDYDDFEAVADSFVRNTPDNCYQIHGHRNTKCVPTQVNERVFNLEGKIEFGGHLRCVQAYPDGTFKTFEVKNDVFRQPEPDRSEPPKNVHDAILALRGNEYVQEKRFGDVSSFNFTKEAFYDKIWDAQTTRARGLYVDTVREKIVARAYDKFFNINERPETKLDSLQRTMAFPAVAYVKENGYLGIVSYNASDDSLFITTKSSPEGDFAIWLRKMLESFCSAEKLEEMKLFVKENDVSLVFECVDVMNDPHIIEYENNALFLLDVVYNDVSYRKYGFDELCLVAERFGLAHKERAFVIESWQEFFDWYYTVTAEDYKWNGKHIEGFVIEDAEGFMVKLKLAYYNFWKFMRSVAHETMGKGYVDKARISALHTPVANLFYGWIKSLYGTKELPADICSLRKAFFETDEGRAFKDQ